MIELVPGLGRVAETQIYDHCFGTPDREVGGVLVGRSADGQTSLVGSIRAESAQERLAALTFTQETWAHIHRVRDQYYADYDIVGWYHSHPGHGIFLSDQDLFIHRHFFSGPGQIAYVVDPVAGLEGVFGWRDGAIATLVEQPTARRPRDRAAGGQRWVPVEVAPVRPSGGAGGVDVALPDHVRLRSTPARPEPPVADAWLPLAPSIYLAVIGLAIGVIFWAVFLR